MDTTATAEITGSLSVLNTGAGDIEIKFDKDKPEELEKAKAMITDMLKRGYAIFIEDEMGETRRVKAFDAEKCAYIVKDAPKEEAEVPVKKARATAVGRSAGG